MFREGKAVRNDIEWADDMVERNGLWEDEEWNINAEYNEGSSDEVTSSSRHVVVQEDIIISLDQKPPKRRNIYNHERQKKVRRARAVTSNEHDV